MPMTTNNKIPNRLANEKSPYLLQHEYNPVNWFPWNEEAFNKARQENKPIFLSIGYSTCHWCHVMERESFEDEEVATLLNKHFISIKVDREERPDIDRIYMEVCQALTGHGGWPLTVFMTPDKKPFYAGTYFPKHTMGQHVGIMELLSVVSEKWRENKSDLLNSAEEITRIIRESTDDYQHREMDDHILERAFNLLEMSFDKKYGGFGNRPKFPTPHNLLYLLRYGVYNQVQVAIEMVEKTLIQMYKGGIFDHIGYGFSRYSVDNKWLVPHFEKMLYDNAMLIIVYTEAYQLTHKKIYKDIAEKIITFVLSEMTNDDGAFYTAMDADSEGEEGKYYIWTKDEIYKILDKDEADYICKYYNITNEGNFEGKNILNLLHLKDEELEENEKLINIRNKLFTERKKRIPPYTDDKILTSINSMMISALAIAGKIFNNKEYLDHAEKCFDFIMKNLIRDDKRLLARYREGEAKYLGYLDDYAYFIWALIELFLSTDKYRYIKLAMEFNVKLLDLFEDSNNGGFFETGKDAEELIMKMKNIYDGAIPSGNSVVTMNLLRLSEITDDIGLSRVAQEQINYFASKINDNPIAYTYMLTAYMFNKAPKRKIVLVANEESNALNNVVKAYNARYLPFTTSVILHKDELDKSGIFAGYDKFTEEIAAYICENYQCNEPIFTEKDILNEIDKMN